MTQPQTDAFDDLIANARRFLSELADNNSKDWFAANKARYDSQLKSPALAVLDHLAADLNRLTGQDVGTKLFRAHRDVRFSKDKTPYHTHLHMLWTTQGAGWFFGISPDYVTLGGGRMGFSKDAIDAWRLDIDGRPGAAIQSELDQLAANGFRISEPELKRIPAPYDATHPRADLLRHKSLTVWRDLMPPVTDLPATAMQVFTQIHPLQQRLARLPD